MADASLRTAVARKRKIPTAEEIVDSNYAVIFVRDDVSTCSLPFCFAKTQEELIERLLVLKVEKKCYIAAGGTFREATTARYVASTCTGDDKGKLVELDPALACRGEWLRPVYTAGSARDVIDFDRSVYTGKNRRRLSVFFAKVECSSMSAIARRESIDLQIKYWEKVNEMVSDGTLRVLHGIYEAGDYSRRLKENDILVDSSDDEYPSALKESDGGDDDEYKPDKTDADG